MLAAITSAVAGALLLAAPAAYAATAGRGIASDPVPNAAETAVSETLGTSKSDASGASKSETSGASKSDASGASKSETSGASKSETSGASKSDASEASKEDSGPLQDAIKSLAQTKDVPNHLGNGLDQNVENLLGQLGDLVPDLY
jgi:hypothetical protein